MKKQYRPAAAALVALLIFCTGTAALAAGVPQKVLRSAESVVYIEVEDTGVSAASGSGFIIAKNREATYFATNYHVVEGADDVYIWVGGENKKHVRVIASSESQDLAILQLNDRVAARPLTLSTEINQGDAVYAVGFPGAAENMSTTSLRASDQATITDGLVSSVRTGQMIEYGGSVSIVQTSADINPGNSGGPLLNEKGEVIGVNAFSIVDTQGIYGAVAASELAELMEKNDLIFAEQSLGFWMVIGAGSAVAAAAVVLWIRRRKGRGNQTMPLNRSEDSLSLMGYISLLTQPLDASSVVSLLMPAALQLRDMHNSGLLFQNLCPACVTVTKDGCRLEKREGMPTEEFLSPERRGGAFAGIQSDIYAFCALLLHTTRAASSPAGESMALLESVIKKGLADSPEDRYASMQGLIYALSPLNGVLPEAAMAPFEKKKRRAAVQRQSLTQPNLPMPVASAGQAEMAALTESRAIMAEGSESSAYGMGEGLGMASVPVALAAEPPKRRLLGLKVALIAVGGVFALVAAYIGVYYGMALHYMDDLDFSAAAAAYRHIPLADTLFPQSKDYFEAAEHASSKEYKTAVSLFDRLGGYRNSKTAKQEAYYQWAEDFAENNDFDEAIAMYATIGSYKDAAELMLDTRYRNACYLISQGSYGEAETTLHQLSIGNYAKAGAKLKELYYLWALDYIEDEEYVDALAKLKFAAGYADASQLLDDVRDLAYVQAVSYYYAGQDDLARNSFTVLGSYRNSNDYITLIEARSGTASNRALFALIGFEDANELIMRFHNSAQAFLTGNWKGSGYYFRMDDKGYISYDLPWFKFGHYYRIENGFVLFYPKDERNNTRKLFAITIIDYNTIQIYAYKNNHSYTLTRQ